MLLGVNWLSPTDLISTFGTIGLLGIIFVESGLFPAPLPGDSLLVLAGAFAATKEHGQPHMNLAVVTIGAFVVAVVGAEIGYWIGRKYGIRLFKPDARIFKMEYHDRAQEFFERRGAPSVVLARFVPIVRTIVPMVAGTTRMQHRKFTTANVIGAALWTVGITMLGFWIGKSIKIDRYIYPIVALIIIVSLIPPFLEYRKHRKAREATAKRPEGSGARSRPEEREATAKRPEGSGARSRPEENEPTAKRPEGSGAQRRPKDEAAQQ